MNKDKVMDIWYKLAMTAAVLGNPVVTGGGTHNHSLGSAVSVGRVRAAAERNAQGM